MENTKINRIAQFNAFSPLKGYSDLILEQERIPEPKAELAPDELERLDQILATIRPGDEVLINYYNGDAYEVISDVVKKIDYTYKVIKLKTKTVPLEDIRNLEHRLP